MFMLTRSLMLMLAKLMVVSTLMFGSVAYADLGGGVQSDASGEFTQLNEGGQQASGAVGSGIQNWKWVIALLVFAPSFLYIGAVNKYLKEKQENDQAQPRPVRVMLFVVAFVAGLISSYVLLGLFGKGFLGTGFNETWTGLVVDQWKVWFGI